MMGFRSPNSQIAIFIYKLIKKHDVKDEGFQLAKELIIEAQQLEFACELNKWFHSGETEVKQIFKIEQYVELDKLLLNRAQTEATEKPILIKFPDHSSYLYSLWSKIDKEGLYNYIYNLFETDPEYSIKLLNAFTPVMSSTAYPEPYQSNFSKENYNFFTSVFDRDIVKKYLFKIYKQEDLYENNIIWSEREGPYQNNLNIVRQFLHWDNPKSEASSNE